MQFFTENMSTGATVLENANRFWMYGLTFSECSCPIIMSNGTLVQGEVNLTWVYYISKADTEYCNLKMWIFLCWLSSDCQYSLCWPAQMESLTLSYDSRKAVVGTYFWNLTVCMWCVMGVKWASISSLELPTAKGLGSHQWKFWVVWLWLLEWLLNGQTKTLP